MSEKIKTPKFRLAWPCIYKKEVDIATGEEKDLYSFTMLIPKDADYSEMERIALDAAKAKWPEKFKNVKVGDDWPKGYNKPFKDGDEKDDYDGYAGCWYCRAMSKFKIAVFEKRGGNVVLCDDEEEVYGGRNCVARITAFAYDPKVNKGVTFGADALLLCNGGEPFSGVSAVDGDEVFGDFEDDEEEFNDI